MAKVAQLKRTQQVSPVADIADGIVLTKDGKYVKLMEYTSINFDLRSASEKNSIIANFERAIRIMPDKAHFKITTDRADPTNFISRLQKQYNEEDNESCCRICPKLRYYSSILSLLSLYFTRRRLFKISRLRDDNRQSELHRKTYYQHPSGLRQRTAFRRLQRRMDAFGSLLCHEQSDIQERILCAAGERSS